MIIHFDNNVQLKLTLIPGAVADQINTVFKHLQQIPLVFKPWDNPYYLDTVTQIDLSSALVQAGQVIGIDVDHARCVQRDQSYYNQLHKIYETNCDGKPAWLNYHELIHLCELLLSGSKAKIATIDYRELAGPLTKKFKSEYLSNLITELTPGTVYVEWCELGKIPYDYWLDNEPEDLDRLCELAKPWIKFRPRLRIAAEYINLLDKIKPEFDLWWQQYHDPWCKHWQVDSWSIRHMRGVIQVGTVDDVNALLKMFQQGHTITKMSLE